MIDETAIVISRTNQHSLATIKLPIIHIGDDILEVWGHDTDEHFYLHYDNQQKRIRDVTRPPKEKQDEPRPYTHNLFTLFSSVQQPPGIVLKNVWPALLPAPKHFRGLSGMSEVKELSTDSKLEILNKHYETMSNDVKSDIQSRDRLLFYTLVLIGVMSFQLFSPSTSGSVISEAITKALRLSKPIDTSFTNTVMWFGLLALIVKYFQTAIRIERKRDYLKTLEKKLADYFDHMAYIWENPYDKDYPTYLHWVAGLYGLGLPVGFVLVAIIKLTYEYTAIEKITLPLVLDIVAGLLIVAFIFQYLLFMYPRLKAAFKPEMDNQEIQ